MNPVVLFIAGAVSGYAVSQSSKAKKETGSGYAGRRALPPGPRVLALGPACSTWEILDRPRADLLVRKAYIEGRLDGITDPYTLTDRAIRLVAPSCGNPRKGMRNIGELDLYTSFFDSILALLVDDFPEASFDDTQAQFNVWHQQQAQVLHG